MYLGSQVNPPQDTQSFGTRNAGASWMRSEDGPGQLNRREDTWQPCHGAPRAGTASAAGAVGWTSSNPRLGQRTLVGRGRSAIRPLCTEEAVTATKKPTRH
jgi:hypothetical protein